MATTPTTDRPARVAIDEADFKSLKHFAEVALGLEVNTGTNSAQLRAKIRTVMPTAKDIPVYVEPAPAAPPPPVPAVAAKPLTDEDGNLVAPANRPAAIERAGTTALTHSSQDPKVKIVIQKTADKTRSRDVTVSVNGEVFRMQRGVEIEVPYRVYLALEDAKEMAAVETDQIHPQSGLPIMDWQEVYSYPFSVKALPSEEVVAAWLAATSTGFHSAV